MTIWSARTGEDLHVRSAVGPQNGWLRRAFASGTGRIRAGAVERDVTFEVPDAHVHSALDAAYHAKYDRCGPAPSDASPAHWPPPRTCGWSPTTHATPDTPRSGKHSAWRGHRSTRTGSDQPIRRSF